MVNKERIINCFCDYVKIDSVSGDEYEFAQKLKADLTKLNIEYTEDNIKEVANSNTNNIYCRLDGTNGKEPILFCTHMDTVVPGKGIKPIIEDGYIKSSGDTILGADDKSAIAAVMEVIQVLKENNIPHRPIDIVFTVKEETGMGGAKNIDYKRLIAKKAYIMDCEGDIGAVINSAPSHYKLVAKIIGKSAHAGMVPEKGISAISVVSKAIDKMKLLRIDYETTANIGQINGGVQTNIVCDLVEIAAEVRSRNEDKAKAQLDHMVECLQNACDEFGAKLEYKIHLAYACYNIPEDDEIITIVKDSCKALNLPFSVTATGGGSDANALNKSGLKSIVLASGMEDMHTTNERISIENLVNMAKLLLQIAIG